MSEPIFTVKIEFADGSNPVTYFNLALRQACEVLTEWSQDYILRPRWCQCSPDNPVWLFDAERRDDDERDDAE